MVVRIFQYLLCVSGWVPYACVHLHSFIKHKIFFRYKD